MQALFSYLGCAVTAVADGQAALACVEADDTAFALAIVDSRMPGLSGPALCARIHAMRSDLPLVLCSGAPHAIEGLPGVSDWLSKPFSLDEAQALLARHGIAS